MKLDVQKAFDCLEWATILATVEKVGMAGTLSAFLRASFSSATYVILLKGRPPRDFKLTRSVRQGCPLSPLIFILALDNLSLTLRMPCVDGPWLEWTSRNLDWPTFTPSTLMTFFS